MKRRHRTLKNGFPGLGLRRIRRYTRTPAAYCGSRLWHALEEEMLLSTHLFYAGFLTYSGAGNRVLQWTETALRVLDAD